MNYNFYFDIKHDALLIDKGDLSIRVLFDGQIVLYASNTYSDKDLIIVNCNYCLL